ncbi:MAG: hypothetical protein LBB31_05100 [Prevotellaceae bacterium]|jgi:hypothetical protein|nr:hypothetical protein [Prevotellaceae bacterium]
MTKKNFFLLLLSLYFLFSCGHGGDVALQAGDLLFQSGKNGLSGAIEAVTEGRDGYHFSHVGMLVPDSSGRLWVIEAIGNGVQLTPVDTFLQRGARVALGRVKDEYKPLLPAAMAFAVQQTGTPYDEEYLYGNGKYYCSELIYDAFLAANNHVPFFTLEPMTFKSPATGAFLEEWIQHYQKLNIPVPESELGCNPGGLSRSEKIEIKNFKVRSQITGN